MTRMSPVFRPLAWLAVAWLLFASTVLQPVHLQDEVHAVLPASALHHAAIHCDKAPEVSCALPGDDLSQPLSGQQHEEHHEAQCAVDTQSGLASADAVQVNAGTTLWVPIEFGVTDIALLSPPLPTPGQSRAPPDDWHLPSSVFLSGPQGRGPPVLV